MRTKTLLITAALGAASLATSMAQVYSVNAVGYINLTMIPNFQLVANQLNQGGNTLNEVLPLSGGMVGAQVQTFTGTDYLVDLFNGTSWEDQNGVPSTTTVPPGKGFFFFNPNPGNEVVTLVGEVPQGTALTVPLAPNYSLVSSIVPQAIPLTPANGFNPTVGFQYQTYDQALLSHPTKAGYEIALFDGSGWQDQDGIPVATPTPAVGQGFFIFNPETTTINWTRCFNVNTPCP